MALLQILAFSSLPNFFRRKFIHALKTKRNVCVGICIAGLLFLSGCVTTAPQPDQPVITEPEPLPPPVVVEPLSGEEESVVKPVQPPPPPAVIPPKKKPREEEVGKTIADMLRRQLGSKTQEIIVLEVTKTQWPDGCLGLAAEGEICTMALVPGYAVTLESGGQRYRYRTDEALRSVRLAAAPLGSIGETVVTWMDTRSSFSIITIGTEGVSFGLRGGPQLGRNLPPDQGFERKLNELTSRFTSFEAVTDAGQISFEGTGESVPSKLEERMVAEWARQVYLEASSRNENTLAGLVLAWHREGGIAGFCDIVAVEIGGEALVSSCRDEPNRLASRMSLTSEQLSSLYNWVDWYKSFESIKEDGAKADGLTIRIVFTGNGLREAGPEEIEAFHRFASGLYLDAYQEAMGESE
jgi:hypothetical protein